MLLPDCGVFVPDLLLSGVAITGPPDSLSSFSSELSDADLLLAAISSSPSESV